jgi:hypothetical protein
MSRTYHHGKRRIRVKGERRNPPDLKRLARILMELVEAQAETDAQAQTKHPSVIDTTSAAKDQPSSPPKNGEPS